MGYDDWYKYTPTKRRPAKGGIAARSKRGQIGETWWSKRFVAVLESMQMGARLTRGRSYARSGQVMDLEVGSGEVTARVQGSRRAAYRVKLVVQPLPEESWARVEEVMAERALFLAQLLAGQMPERIEEVFKASELSLFPASRRALRTECSCPDWANPCKHIAAVLYILAEAFDTDPFLIFRWRGRSRRELTENLKRLRGRQVTESAEDADEEEVASPLGDQLDHYFESTAVRAVGDANEGAPPVPEAALLARGPAEVQLGGQDLTTYLSGAYGVFSRHASQRLQEALEEE